MSYTIPHFQDGWSPLHIACQENRGEIVDRLLIAKADVNLQTEVGIVVISYRNEGEASHRKEECRD